MRTRSDFKGGAEYVAYLQGYADCILAQQNQATLLNRRLTVAVDALIEEQTNQAALTQADIDEIARRN